MWIDGEGLGIGPAAVVGGGRVSGDPGEKDDLSSFWLEDYSSSSSAGVSVF